MKREDVKLGAFLSPPDELDAIGAFGDSHLLVGSGTSFDPQPVDLFPLHRPRVQQRQNCVAHARMNVLQIFMWIRAGAPGPLLSVDWAYAQAQLLRKPPPPGGHFPDTGSNCALMLKAIRDHGVVSEAVYPEEGDNGIRIPPAGIWQRGAAATVTGAHRLAEGPDAPAQLATALAVAAAGGASAPNIVLPADDAMGAVPDDGLLEGTGGEFWGWHDQAVLAFDPKRGARGAFGIADTWGRRRYWLSWDVVAKHGREMLITEAVPAAPIAA